MADRTDLICHVCLGDITLTARGVVAEHVDGGHLCPMSGELPYKWNEPDTRQAVAGRSGRICESCAAARGTEMHHRKSRGVGGDWSPANIVHLCHECHHWVTNHPEEAYACGLSVRSTDDPEKIPVLRRTPEGFFLSNDILPPPGRKISGKMKGRR